MASNKDQFHYDVFLLGTALFSIFAKLTGASPTSVELEEFQKFENYNTDFQNSVDDAEELTSQDFELEQLNHKHQHLGIGIDDRRSHPLFVKRCLVSPGDDLKERRGYCLHPESCLRQGGSLSKSKCNCDGLSEQLCCVFEATCNRATESITVKRDLTYITHRQNEEECITDYRFPRQNNVCQLRLEFKQFDIALPNRTGDCLSDKLTVRRAENLRDNLVICGRTNEIDHLFLHYGESNEIVVNLDVLQSTTTGNVEILVQQIRCNSADLAPEGCTQYFTQQRGDVRSFNYDTPLGRGQQLNNQVYSVCIRGSEGSNAVMWSPCIGIEDFDIASINLPTDPAATTCPSDSVTIPGTLNPKYCARGSFSTPVETRAKPYVMYVNFNQIELIPILPPTTNPPCGPGYVLDPTDATACTPDPNGPLPDLNNRGFCLRYQRT